MTQQKRQFSLSQKSILSLCCGLAVVSLSHSVVAAEFFTIIGPDGRPMVVQQRPEKKAEKTIRQSDHTDHSKKSSRQAQQKVQQKAQPERQHALQKDTHQPNMANDLPKNEKQKKQARQSLETHMPIEQSKQQNIQSTDRIQSPKDSATVDSSTSQVQSEIKQNSSTTSQNVFRESSKQNLNQNQAQNDEVQPVEKLENKTSNSAQVPTLVSNSQTQQAKITADSKMNVQNNKSVDEPPSVDHVQRSHQNITEIDGVKYVDNEYLEDKEFNLEGRKRFYIMPDSSIAGSSRFETVEREKGITKSVFSKFMKKNSQDAVPVVLAPTYYRLPKDEVVRNLEQACFSGKKIDKAKELSLDRAEIGFWPVPPIKEKFVYDVVKLDQRVENIHFSSYASSQKNPSYYWPLVVFLDQQGCVIEGVSGFKNQDTQANNLKYSALEGVLKKPNEAMYLFMTPLAEAIDVQDVQLSNQGQIKLSVLR